MSHELAMMDWETLLKGRTVDRQWQAFKERIGELQKLFIPIWRKGGKGTVAKLWPDYGLQAKFKIALISKKHTKWQAKTINLGIGNSLKFSKGRPGD